jgi:hypothetical protein
MEFRPGAKIILKGEYIKKFTKEEHDSRSFQIVALTDNAVGVRNIRSQRMYTLPLEAVSRNIDIVATANLTKPIPFFTSTTRPDVVIVSPPVIPIPPPFVPTPKPMPVPAPTPPPLMFTHVAPLPKGGITIKSISAQASVISSDNPFSSLYGNG